METLRQMRERERENGDTLRELLDSERGQNLSAGTRALAKLAIDLADIGAGRKFYADHCTEKGFRLYTRKHKPREIRRKVPSAALCGATTRKGTPCQCLPVEGRDRCKFHGGASTGPKTDEGRARIAESNRRRAQARRDALEQTTPKQ